jgi:hypothetical protein
MERLPKRLHGEYSEVLFGIFDLMLRTGIKSRELEGICKVTLKRAAAKAHFCHSDETGGLMTVALVLDVWHRDRRYLTRGGAPKPVRLLGPVPSVEAMVRSQRPRRNAAEIAQKLKKLGLLVPHRRALYKPSSDVAVVSERSPLVLQHTVRALSALLGTVGRNVNRQRGLSPLIERHAEVPDLPRTYVKAFENFTQAQGKIFLRTVNDWLEARRSRGLQLRNNHQTVRAGVHTYAYIAPNKSPRTKK